MSPPKTAPPPGRRSFRFGFACFEPGAGVEIPKELARTWRCEKLRGADIWIHPEAGTQRVSLNGRTLLLIGELTGAPLADRFSPNDEAQGDTLLDALDGMCGRFVLIEEARGSVRLYPDAIGSQTIFYSDGDGTIAASHAALAARLAGRGPCPKVAELTSIPEHRNLRMNYLPGDATFYEGIFALTPNHSLDIATGRAARFWPRRPVATSAADDFADQCADYLRAFRDDILQKERIPLFGLTGGIDSRTIYAAFTETNTPFETVTWLGPFFNPAEQDITGTLIKTLARPHHYLKPSDFPKGKVARIGQKNIGEHRRRSNLLEGMYATYGNRPEMVFIPGFGGALIRGFYNVGKPGHPPMTDLSPGEMTRAYTRGLPHQRPDRQWIRLAEAWFTGFAERLDMDSALTFGHDPNDIFFWEHRLGIGTNVKLNQMDVAVFSMAGYNSRPLFETAFGLPPEERFSKSLQLRVVERLDPALAAIPVHNLKPPSKMERFTNRLSTLRGFVTPRSGGR